MLKEYRFYFQERPNFIKKIMTSKIQNGGRKSQWQQNCNFLLKNRPQHQLLKKLRYIFVCDSPNIDPKNILSLWCFIAETQDGDKIQNGT
jgi:hypothetical protein